MVSDFNADIVPHLALHLLRAPPPFKTLWVISTCVTLAVVLLSLKHLSALILVGTRLRRQRDTVFQPVLVTLYKYIFCFFPLMAVLSWAGLFAPKLSLMFLLVVRLYEFGCLLWFWELMIDLLDGPDNAYRILSQKEPSHVLKVFPCCLTPYIYSKRRLRKRDIAISWWLVAQYGPVNVVSILSVSLSSHLQSLFTGLSAASLVACMHGLFILYSSSHSESKEFKLSLKFLVIKLSVMIIKLVEILVRIPGVVQPYEFPYNEALMGMTWLAFTMNMTSLVFTAAAMFAFPAKEVSARIIKHVAQQHIKMQALERGALAKVSEPGEGEGTLNSVQYGDRDSATEEMMPLSPPKNVQRNVQGRNLLSDSIDGPLDSVPPQTSTEPSDSDMEVEELHSDRRPRIVGKSAFGVITPTTDAS